MACDVRFEPSRRFYSFYSLYSLLLNLLIITQFTRNIYKRDIMDYLAGFIILTGPPRRFLPLNPTGGLYLKN